MQKTDVRFRTSSRTGSARPTPTKARYRSVHHVSFNLRATESGGFFRCDRPAVARRQLEMSIGAVVLIVVELCRRRTPHDPQGLLGGSGRGHRGGRRRSGWSLRLRCGVLPGSGRLWANLPSMPVNFTCPVRSSIPAIRKRRRSHAGRSEVSVASGGCCGSSSRAG
jgi:hypothetical protein